MEEYGDELCAHCYIGISTYREDSVAKDLNVTFVILGNVCSVCSMFAGHVRVCSVIARHVRVCSVIAGDVSVFHGCRRRECVPWLQEALRVLLLQEPIVCSAVAGDVCVRWFVGDVSLCSVVA